MCVAPWRTSSACNLVVPSATDLDGLRKSDAPCNCQAVARSMASHPAGRGSRYGVPHLAAAAPESADGEDTDLGDHSGHANDCPASGSHAVSGHQKSFFGGSGAQRSRWELGASRWAVFCRPATWDGFCRKRLDQRFSTRIIQLPGSRIASKNGLASQHYPTMRVNLRNGGRARSGKVGCDKSRSERERRERALSCTVQSGSDPADKRWIAERGMVTTEAAFAMGALSMLAVAMSWVIALSVGQAQLMAGAREGARAAARGEPTAGVFASAARVAPHARVQVHRIGRQVKVVLTQRREPPGLLSGLGRTLRAEAVAAVEP